MSELFSRHPRTHQGSRYVYPVFARRSRGISIGINLNPDKKCNFDCPYCQVDRHVAPEVTEVDEPQLLQELDAMIGRVTSGALYDDPRFSAVPPEQRRLNDLAFSGDGEPTSYPRFADLVAHVALQKQRHRLDAVKLVLITNASLFQRADVQRGLAILDQNQGEIWAKLDAGTPEYHRLISRSRVPLKRILDNLTEAARARPLVIQSMFLRMHGDPAPASEIEAWCDRLADIRAAGGRIDRVQIYTVSRATAEPWVTGLDARELEQIAEALDRRTGIRSEVFGAT
ncbi:MAG: radical SAM protein [Deltaproteobacteria bacterium]|nr:radical SAM protein [Deltaproteobacteria bacterium]